MAKYASQWIGIDRGRESWLRPKKWMDMLKVLSQNEGESFRDPASALYRALTALDPGTAWISTSDPGHNFFRDYQTPWTLTGVLVPTKESRGHVRLTELGRMLASGKVSQRAVMIQAMARHQEEAGEHSFAVLANAFIRLGNPSLTINQVFHCVVKEWRPGDGDINIIPDEDCTPRPQSTVRRRLKSLLSIMQVYGALAFDGSKWSVGDEQLLEAVACGAAYPAPSAVKVPRPADAVNDVWARIDMDIENAVIASGVSVRDSQVKMVLREIAARRGQAKFRKQLLDLYHARCAVTCWDSQITLEAAHIMPVAMDGSDDVNNGLLLRSDIHTLFDLHCLGIDPQCWKVRIAPCIKKTMYAELEGRPVVLPASLADYPSRQRLRSHLQSLRAS